MWGIFGVVGNKFICSKTEVFVWPPFLFCRNGNDSARSRISKAFCDLKEYQTFQDFDSFLLAWRRGTPFQQYFGYMTNPCNLTMFLGAGTSINLQSPNIQVNIFFQARKRRGGVFCSATKTVNAQSWGRTLTHYIRTERLKVSFSLFNFFILKGHRPILT